MLLCHTNVDNARYDNLVFKGKEVIMSLQACWINKSNLKSEPRREKKKQSQ